jgi:hypothetical protein
LPREATVEFAELGAQTLGVTLADAESDYDDKGQFCPMQLNSQILPPLTSRENVISYGTLLTTQLSAHNGLQQELTQLFGTTPPNQAKLHLVFRTPRAEAFRWEALCNAAEIFLAVHVDCSLKRIPGNGPGRNPPLRLFNWPLKLTAFLSAAGISARHEFEAISGAIKAARDDHFDVQGTIYLGEQELLDSALTDVADGKWPGVEVRSIPASSVAIDQALRDDPPHLLHFFCHGIIEAREQLLEMASITDHDKNSDPSNNLPPIGSVKLSVKRLHERLVAENKVWMTVLNSCSGAEHVPKVFSMAGVLAKTASPITVAMAERIEEDDATLFSSIFYPEAFGLLKASIGDIALGIAVAVDLAPAVTKARKTFHALCEEGPPDRFGRWCLPTVYQRNQPLRVARTEHPEWQRMIEGVALALLSLPSNAPAALRQQFLNQLDLVPAGWRPDGFGNLP